MEPVIESTGAADGAMELVGRLTTASNATFLATIGHAEVVYKPIAGERPLWDFPDGRLAHREVASYLVSEALGWSVVPETWLGEGPHGVGMVQRWISADESVEPVTIVPEGEIPDGFRHVFDGYDALDQVVSLAHEDTPALRRMAVFDAITNNADRKGGHVLPLADGHRFGCDHGLTFHEEPKLRTILWGWQGLGFSDEELAGIRTVHAGLSGALGRELAAYLSGGDLEALALRCEALLAEGVFPQPEYDRHVIPWPPF
ncbi:SCO1664 family protein [Nocardioides albus]|uniref:Putative repeat protein (TIGR03843 family) n=1 Tax=Nocardioides albus TaxID=1841 RepID=A0A7W5A3T5_9ACTN|nr:SCO1664 family protein [Nocardioides albus]MBB3088965.1 putative repeat protein (TIGR03843 family) [Nocardioides albus]GGU15166.1 phosphatidylinositol kinase [Nocardioides albus]